MKNLIALFFILTSAALWAQDGPEIKFETLSIDYGTIEQNSNGVREFKFKNVGNQPLVIQNAKGSCGCTVPSYPPEPVLPGEGETISVKYDTKRIGPFTKNVTLTTNSINTPSIRLTIKGIVKAPSASEPAQH